MNEFELIQHCFHWPHNNSDIITAVGDDASIVQVPQGYQLVQSIDTQIADVHFPAHAPADLIAQRALRCAISDLAAMGAKPQAFHLALSLPSQTTQQWLESFSSGLRDCAEEYQIALIGGDTTSCPSIVISIQVQGLVKSNRALTRDGAQINDKIWLSGELGNSAAALKNIIEKPQQFIAKPTENPVELACAYYYPHAQISLGQQLIGIATSAMDISDGLLQDASHIAKASHCQLNIDAQKIRLNPQSIAQHGIEQAREFALTGGDDYHLLFTAGEHHTQKLQALGCYDIGQVNPLPANTHTEKNPQWVLLNGKSIHNARHGYQHF